MVELVVPSVNGLTWEHNEVGRMIVPGIEIFMVNDFTLLQIPTQYNLRNLAVNVVDLSVPCCLLVPRLRDRSSCQSLGRSRLPSHALMFWIGVEDGEACTP